MMRRTNSSRMCYCGRRSMTSSPMYVAWMCSTRVSPAAMEFTASFMTATALDTAWRSLRASWLLDQGVMVRSSSMHCFMPDPPG